MTSCWQRASNDPQPAEQIVSTARAPKRALPLTDPRELSARLARLDARERRILELRYGIGEPRCFSLKQIGRRFGISGERVRQIEVRALQRLAENAGNVAAKPAGAVKRVTPRGAYLPRNALQAWTLLLLRSEPAHGYDLLRRMAWPGAEVAGPRLYRLLRDLEQERLVHSDWADSAGGPERRVYRLTSKGARELKDEAQLLHQLLEALQVFFKHYDQPSASPANQHVADPK